MSNSNYYDYRYRDTRDPSGNHLPGWLLGLMAGAAVGGGLALLFAPRQGAAMRQDLAAGAQQAGRRLSQAYDSVAGTAHRSAERLVAEGKRLRGEAAKSLAGEPAVTTGQLKPRTQDTLADLGHAVGQTPLGTRSPLA